jgi:PAS domain S-box-containing protein
LAGSGRCDAIVVAAEGEVGIDAIGKLRQRMPDTRIVFAPSRMLRGQGTEALQSGADEYIHPRDTDRLRVALTAGTEQSIGSYKEEDEPICGETFRSVVEASPSGTALVRSDKTVAYANDAFARLFGFERDEMIGQELGALLGDATNRSLVELLDGSQPGGRRVADVECDRTNEDGTQSHVLVSMALLDSDDRGPWVLINAIDITERSQFLQRLRQSEAKLRQAVKMEALGRLASGIAHDFNNQLTVMKGYCDMMLVELADDNPAVKGLREVTRAIERASSLTAQLSVLGRKQPLSPQVVDLNEILRRMSDPLARILGEDIKLKVIADPAPGRVLVDASQVEQTLMNLVVNARAAMPEGGTLTIETANVTASQVDAGLEGLAPDAPLVMLLVRDTGCGMAEEVRNHIFEPFFTTKGKGEGTGLGLAMVYGFVQQSGGSIRVDSEPGQGTTFRICLPRASGQQRSAVRLVGKGAASSGSETLMLVEDDESVRQMLTRVLKARGYQVLTSGDPVDALRQVRVNGARRIDLLITDVIMPEMSGPELAERLRELRPETRVMYISGYVGNALVQEAARRHGARLLAKPFSADTLADAVRQALDQEVCPAP